MAEEEMEQTPTAAMERLEKKLDSLEQRVLLLSDKKPHAARGSFGLHLLGWCPFHFGRAVARL
jgi:hypothetical protein